MKKKSVKLIISVFALSLVGSFVLLVSFLDIFKEFKLITDKSVVIGAGIASLAFAIVVLTYTISRIKSERTSKLENWLSNNTAKILLYYIVANIFFVSIRSEVVWTQEEMRNLVSLEWSIFGISITIFLVWNVLVVNYLKEKKPQKPSEVSSVSTLRYILDKSSFYGTATLLFNTVSLLTCNLVLLTLATTMVYMPSDRWIILKQAVVTLVLYFSTNTIIVLFLDIIQPLKEERKVLLEESKVTSKDIETQNRIVEKSNKVFTAIDEIAQLEHLSKEEKDKITMELLRDFLEGENAEKKEADNKVGV